MHYMYTDTGCWVLLSHKHVSCPATEERHDLSPTVVHSLVDTLVEIVAAQEQAAKERGAEREY